MDKPIPPRLTDREKLALKERLRHASNEEIGKLFGLLKYNNPFTYHANKLFLPSYVRRKALEQVFKWIDSDMLSAKPT